MKIYVDESLKICAINSTDRTDLQEIEVDRNTLGDWCDAALFGYAYTPSYLVGENGEPILDENGNKVQAGFAFYPAIDFNIIQSIQHLHEQEQEVQEALELELMTSVVDNDYRLSMVELGL